MDEAVNTSEKEVKAGGFNEVAPAVESINSDTMSIDQVEFLYDLCYGLPKNLKGEVVEIGTNVGKSTIGISAALKHTGRGKLNTVDIYKNEGIDEHLTRAGMLDQVNQIVEPSHSVARRWNKPVSFLWIDGDHSYTGVLTDIKRWSKFVEPGGLIALHDYPGHIGSMVVARAVRKTYFRNPFEYKLVHDRKVGSIIVFQKMENPKKGSGGGRWFYWQYRNVRSVLSRMMPGLTQKIVKWMHQRDKK